jgi:hypothetical protein
MSLMPRVVLDEPLAAMSALFPSMQKGNHTCPVDGCLPAKDDFTSVYSPFSLVFHLNDQHKWSRTCIADHLDTLGHFPLEGTKKDAEDAARAKQRQVDPDREVGLEAMAHHFLPYGTDISIVRTSEHLWITLRSGTFSAVQHYPLDTIKLFMMDPRAFEWAITKQYRDIGPLKQKPFMFSEEFKEICALYKLSVIVES